MVQNTAAVARRVVCALCVALLVPASLRAQSRAMFSRPSPDAQQAASRAAAAAGQQVLRDRQASADLTVLTSRRSVDLNLFDDVDLVAQFDRVDAVAPFGFAWVGGVAGMPGSAVVLSVADGVLTGTVKLPGKLYSIRPSGGSYAIAEIDTRTIPVDRISLPPPSPAATLARAALSADSGDEIDLLLYYTPAVRQAIGGPAALGSFIAGSIAEVNAVYASSGIAARVRLVAALELGYADSGSTATDLAALRNNADVRAARERYGADLVSMLVARDPASSGLAYVSVSQGQIYDDYGYSVAVYYPTIGYVYSLAHELGHNLGCLHERGNNGGGDAAGAFPYSLGYTDAAHGFHDVMSYGAGCPTCIKVDALSNPLITFRGSPVGTDAQDAARTINVTRAIVANFRSAAAAPPPSAPIALTSTVTGSTVALTWRPPASGTATGYAIEAGSSAGAADLANVATGSTATAFTAEGVAAGTYYVRVRATNGSRTGDASNEVTIVVGGGGR
jgi:peptidyl-Asp metalloendopeptidase